MALVISLARANGEAQTISLGDVEGHRPFSELSEHRKALFLPRLEQEIRAHELRLGTKPGADLAARVNEATSSLLYDEVRSGEPLTVFQGNTISLCGMNCAVWIANQNGHILLAESGFAVTFLAAQHHGLADVRVETEDSAFVTLVAYYRYNGRQYRVRRCTREVRDDLPSDTHAVRIEPRSCHSR